MTKPIIFTLIGAALLASCGPQAENISVDKPANGLPEETKLAPAENAIGIGSETLTAAYDAVNDQITLTDGANSILLPEESFGTPAAFQEYSTSSGFVAYGVTNSGAGYAAAALSDTNRVLGGVAGAAFGRLTDTEMPDNGSATYTGSYEGVLGDSGDYEPYNILVIGDVEMTADFDTNNISGTISNRLQFGDGDTLDDVTLNMTSIENGGFIGKTSGGDFPGASGSPSQGEYSGMFVGANGQEIVGGLLIEHTDFVEAGAFILD